jgi:hypothetical protein
MRWLLSLACMVALPGFAGAVNGPSPALPEVLLIVDDSVTWENSFNGGAPPDCNLCNSSPSAGCRTDWTVLEEVLTGAYTTPTFLCDRRNQPAGRPDQHEPMDHFVPSNPGQATDGLLDQFATQIKFGLLTLDHEPDASAAQDGEWSQGNPTTCMWQSGQGNQPPQQVTFNLGAKSAGAGWGAFTSVPWTDNAAAVQLNNGEVQAQLLSDLPWDGFRAAALLDDAYQYLSTDTHFRPWDGQFGDPYFDCRQRAAVVLVHGQEDVEYVGGTCLAPLADRVALIAQQAGIPVYAVSYRASAQAMAAAEVIAMNGGTEQAVHTATPNRLRMAISDIVDSLTESGSSLVSTVATNATRSLVDVVDEFNLGYSSTAGRRDPAGILEGTIFRCNDSCNPLVSGQGPEACELVSLSRRLADRADIDRAVWTQQNGELLRFETDFINANLLGIPTSGTLLDIRPSFTADGLMEYDPNQVLGDASDPTIRELYADTLVQFVRGEETSRRYDRPFGALRYAQPVIAAAPALNVSALGYGTFKEMALGDAQHTLVRNRATVLYSQTHDGLVHAFRVDRPAGMNDSEYGEELWAFLPRQALDGVKDLPFTFPAFLLDGSLVVRDILLRRDLSQGEAEVAESWRTVLVGTCGTACRGAFALDVTDPLNPQFMWEVRPGRRCYNNPDEGDGCVDTAEYDRLGYTVSRPDLGVVFASNYLGETGSQERAVAVLGGGQDTGVPGNPDGIGRNVFVLDLLSGRVVNELRGGVSPAVVHPVDELTANLVGDVTGYNTFPGRVMTKAFLGDAGGRLWRLDVSALDPQDWRMDLLLSTAEHVQDLAPPFKQAPTVALDNGWNGLLVLANSGGNRYLGDTGQVHAAVSLREAFTLQGGALVLTPQLVWLHQFEAGEVPTSQPIVFNNVAYFSTYLNNLVNPCRLGDGRIYGVSFNQPGTGTPPGFVPALDDPLSVQNRYYEYDKTFIAGLSLVFRPPCTPQGSLDWIWQQAGGGGQAPTASQMSGGRPTLVASTGLGGNTGGGQVPGSSTAPKVTTIALPMKAAPRNLIFSSWGLVFE